MPGSERKVARRTPRASERPSGLVPVTSAPKYRHGDDGGDPSGESGRPSPPDARASYRVEAVRGERRGEPSNEAAVHA